MKLNTATGNQHKLVLGIAWLAIFLLISNCAYSDEYVPFYGNETRDQSSDINPGLYPPLSSGEASPWQDESKQPEPGVIPRSVNDNPWSGATATPDAQAYRGLPAQTGVPHAYPYQPGVPQAYQYQPGITPYPYQGVPGYGYATPGMLPAPYPYASPYGAPGYVPPGYYNNGFNPFNFSFPWPF